MEGFKSGFVNIIGFPNAGKSTLINALVKAKISIVTPKAQTTRTRLLGFLNGEGYQIVFSDTPGILDPAYELQKMMLAYVDEALRDADIVLYITDATEKAARHDAFLPKLKKLDVPILILVNKIDLAGQDNGLALYSEWAKSFEQENIFLISALHGFNLDELIKRIIELLPVHPAYYEDDILTDKSERFVASEVIREKVFLYYKEEIPYSTEVIVGTFKESDDIIHIHADIIVERDSQKPIIIGKGGMAIKKVGTLARHDLEDFFKKKVYLELYVKVRENWRRNKNMLGQFGYRTGDGS